VSQPPSLRGFALAPLWAEWGDFVGWESAALLLAGLAAAYLLLLILRPYAAVKLALLAVTRSVLWIRSEGRSNVPAKGPAVLVCNPLSYLGWLLILTACPRRVRFLILAGWTVQGVPGWLLRRVGAITPAGSDAGAIDRAITAAGEALARGEVVCLFAEGCRLADGAVVPLSRVFDRVTARTSVPIVPVCVQQPQASLFGIHGGKFVRHLPPEFPSPAWVRFGAPLPAGTPAATARQEMQELGARLAVSRRGSRLPVHRRFVRMAARHPFRVCWIDSTAPGQDMNYAKAYVGSVCLAALLRPTLGETPMVAIWLPPGRGGALANVALALLGKVSVNLNYTSSADGIRSALRQCGCKVVLTARKFTARLALDPGPGVELIYLDDLLPKLTKGMKSRALLAVILLPGWLLERLLGLSRHSTDDVATVIFSSGSTGEPKGVQLTHDNVAANVESIVQAVTLGPTDRMLGVLPFFHSFGYTVTLWAPLQVGAAGVYHADPRQAREIGELCKKNRCTIYLSTATFLRFCLKKCDPDDFRSIRGLVCGAEKLPPGLAEEFFCRFGVMPLEGYGCTELSPVVATNLPDQVCAGLTQTHNRTGTVGAPLPGIAARAVDPDTREVLPPGEEGMLVVTGANVMKGYLNKPDLTAAVMVDGWYITGDMARIDAEGHITITGRLSRFAKVAGEMVPLEKIEEALHDALGTSERVCVVACVPDESRGERVVVLYVVEAFLVFDLTLRQWSQKLSAHGLPNLWVPGERDFHAVPELPVLGSGKVNLKGVKDLALRMTRGQGDKVTG
jgi:acyl-[acyl-carrier-protein]-phospholipid O-acyltransferase / long-chain-fatty-acid--[acyl-carrier-protein] ligase